MKFYRYNPRIRLYSLRNTPILYAAIFDGCKILISRLKLRYFLSFASNIDFGFVLKPPH